MKYTIKGFAKTRVVYVNGSKLDPSDSIKVRNHSPDGFNWGYGGSGPAQLALGILLHVFSEEVARRNYQDFKWEVISKLPQNEDFEIEVDLEKYSK